MPLVRQLRFPLIRVADRRRFNFPAPGSVAQTKHSPMGVRLSSPALNGELFAAPNPECNRAGSLCRLASTSL